MSSGEKISPSWVESRYRALRHQRMPETGSAVTAERPKLEAVQELFDRPFQALDIIMPPPDRRDSLDTYVVGLASRLEPFTAVPVKELKMAVGDPVKTAEVAGKIVKQALEAASRQPELHSIVGKDRTGRFYEEFVGDKSSWMRRFKAPVMTGGDSETGEIDGSIGLKLGDQRLHRIR
jgi:hypothetical protein